MEQLKSEKSNTSGRSSTQTRPTCKRNSLGRMAIGIIWWHAQHNKNLWIWKIKFQNTLLN